MVKRASPYYHQGQSLEELKPLIQDARDMARRLCSEIGTAPIENIAKWHRDMLPNSHIKRLVRCIRYRGMTRHKGEYFNWEEVLASMWLRPHEVYFPCSTPCDDCGKWTVIANVYSPAWTWANLCGRGGIMLFCPHCKKQIKYVLTIMN